jgi:hypothetical protein
MATGLEENQYYELRDETIKSIQEIPGINDALSWRDILDVLRYPPSYLGKPFKKITDKEFTKLVVDELLTEVVYHFYFPLYNVYGFPDGYQLGHATLHVYSSLPAPVKDHFDREWKHRFEMNKEHASSLEEYLGRKRDAVFLYVSVKAQGHEKAGQKATKLADESVHILRAIYMHDFGISEYAYITGKGTYAGSYLTLNIGWSTYTSRFDNTIGKLTNILTKQDPNDIENRLRNAIILFGIETEAARPEVRYTLLTTALEGLLLTEGDRDYLRLKLAEKISFLLENNLDKRLELFEKVKDVYDRRSDFVHQKPKFKPITQEEVEKLGEIFIKVFNKLLELRNQGYEQIQKKDGAKTIDDLVTNLKFD